MLTGPVFLLVLAGAALHAAWNVAVRGARDRRREAALVVAGGALLAAPALPFLPLPRSAAWPWLAGSVALHVAYFALLAEAYARGAVALAYPLMRGTAPALAALLAWPLFGEALPPPGWLGVGAVCGGVLLLALGRRAADPAAAAVACALANAAVIAAYTLVDAAGARAAGDPVAYTLWLFVLMAFPTVPVLLRFRLAVPGRAEAARALGGGAASVAAYALALWAMAQAPVAAVAALRETATLFGLVLARLLLGERPGAAGWAGAGAIAAGAALLRLA
ncbi:EamA family transporter [Caldovatus aquaticus]|uniref:EamA family transporter n=1 Tax=Caldovatus aquaticus TaxID=2865671 RepID=A0ABS7F0H3_9PROT|nr:EamA family transporter [Caldovatus aquaticus]MBW8269131.1 EamA family transporter [Caldovatus aquaticus]